MTKNIFQLNNEEKEMALKAIKEIHSATAQLHEWIKNDNLTEEFAGGLPFLIESKFITLSKVLNYESKLTKDFEERYKEIKKANEKIRVLEKKIGSDKPIDGLKEQLRYLRDIVRDWWAVEGFNHISEESFMPYGGLKLKLCFMLDSRRNRTLSKNPAKDRCKLCEHLEYLKNVGFEFYHTDNEKLQLIDNPTNRKLLKQMLVKRFPSVDINSFVNSSSYEDEDIFIIRSIDVIIHDLSDIPCNTENEISSNT